MGCYDGVSGFMRRSETQVDTCSVPPCDVLCHSKKTSQMLAPCSGRPRLQNHEPNKLLFFINYPASARHRWLTPVILATQEVAIRRIWFEASLGK
jgi:hypothetical protein